MLPLSCSSTTTTVTTASLWWKRYCSRRCGSGGPVVQFCSTLYGASLSFSVPIRRWSSVHIPIMDRISSDWIRRCRCVMVVVSRNSCRSSSSSSSSSSSGGGGYVKPSTTTSSCSASSSSNVSTRWFPSWTISWHPTPRPSPQQQQLLFQRIVMGIVLTGISFTIGFTLGQEYRHDDQDLRLLPNGLPRTCCNNSDANHDTNRTMGDTNHPNDNIQPDGHSHSHPPPPPPPSHNTTTPTVQELQDQLVLLTEQQQFIQRLRRMIGKDNVILVDEESHNTPYTTQTAPYLKGARIVHARGGPTTVDTTATLPHHRTIIVTPQQLHHVVNIVEACQQQNTMAQQPPSHPTGEKDSTRKNHYTCTVIPQGQNTGLTGGSTPRYDHHNNHHSQYYHMTIVLSLKQLNAIIPLDDGQRVCCMAGVGLASLEQFIQQHFPDRESHSILGSTFLNPTTAAGVAFGSGGTQCRKGPAYTERALYLRMVENKWQEQQLEIVNTLQIDGFNDSDLPIGERRKQMDTIPYRIDTWGRWIQKGYERDMKYTTPSVLEQIKNGDETYPLASDIHYRNKLCRRDSTSVSRYNADCSGPDCCRSEGKVIILATVHDTFPKPKSKKTYWMSFDTIETALEFRKQVALHNPTDLPISMEYMDRDAFDVIDEAGRVLGNLIKYIGTSSTLIRQLWNVKLYIEALPYRTAPLWVDQIIYRLNNYFPSILPKSIMEIGHQWDHHVMMTIGDFGDGSMDRMMERMNDFAQQQGSDKIRIIECDCHTSTTNGDVAATTAALNAFRFVAAPAFRTWCVGQHLQGFSVDYALPKNGGSIPPLYRNDDTVNPAPFNASTSTTTTGTNGDTTNASSERPIPVKRMRYSHFACNVVHEDLAYDVGVDIEHAKHTLKDVIEYECSGKLPAEHGHGTEYIAPPTTQERWKRMDPLNIFNPGIGGLSQNFRYKDD